MKGISTGYWLVVLSGLCACSPSSINGTTDSRNSSPLTTMPAGTDSNQTTDSNTAMTNNANDSNTNNSNSTNANNSNATTALNGNVLLSTDFEQPLPNGFTLVGSANVVTSQAAHGTHALELAGQAGYNGASFLITTSIFPLKNPVLYIRFYIKVTQPIAQGHATYSLVSDGMNEIRLSGQFGILEWNYSPNDALRISGNNSNFNTQSGATLSTTKWTCLEYMVDTQAQALRVYLDGTENTNMAILKPSDWNTVPSSSPWMPKLTTAKIGFQEYGAAGPNTVYLDDVVFASSRIGCL